MLLIQKESLNLMPLSRSSIPQNLRLSSQETNVFSSRISPIKLQRAPRNTTGMFFENNGAFVHDKVDEECQQSSLVLDFVQMQSVMCNKMPLTEDETFLHQFWVSPQPGPAMARAA